jgi:hypothetical protein
VRTEEERRTTSSKGRARQRCRAIRQARGKTEGGRGPWAKGQSQGFRRNGNEERIGKSKGGRRESVKRSRVQEGDVEGGGALFMRRTSRRGERAANQAKAAGAPCPIGGGRPPRRAQQRVRDYFRKIR